MSASSDEWQVWLDELEPRRRAAAQALRAQFDEMGVAGGDAEGWVMSEIDEDIPQLARYVLLRSLWRGAIGGWGTGGALEQLPAAQRLIAAGADVGDLGRVAQAVAYEAVFTTLDELDTGSDVNAAGIDVGWCVTETGEDAVSTGRALTGLHEDLLGMDPSGQDGTDLWQ